MLYLHLMRRSYEYLQLSCICRTILASLEHIQLLHDKWYCRLAVRFDSLVFCWEYLYLCLSEILSHSFLLLLLFIRATFCYQITLGLIYELERISSLSLWDSLRNTVVSFSLRNLVDFRSGVIGVISFGRHFITDLMSQFIIWSLLVSRFCVPFIFSLYNVEDWTQGLHAYSSV